MMLILGIGLVFLSLYFLWKRIRDFFSVWGHIDAVKLALRKMGLGTAGLLISGFLASYVQLLVIVSLICIWIVYRGYSALKAYIGLKVVGDFLKSVGKWLLVLLVGVALAATEIREKL
jgi:hypothetical protein